ncbi:MAG TPA: hypothetical protein VIL29_01785, partial [Pseudothermotoga sp.]
MKNIVGFLRSWRNHTKHLVSEHTHHMHKNLSKAQRIKETLRATKERRKTQIAKSYTLKLQNISNEKREKLIRAFLEAKWFYNWCINQQNIFEIDGNKIKKVEVKVGDKFEERELVVLSGQVKQGIVDKIKYSIKGLSAMKKSGDKIGRLKPKKKITSIPLMQYGITYTIDFEKHKIRLPKIGWIRVLGLHQIPEGAEITSAELLWSSTGFYVNVICFVPKEHKAKFNKAIAVDFGIKDKLTLSNGIKIDFEFPETKRIKKLQKELA